MLRFFSEVFVVQFHRKSEGFFQASSKNRTVSSEHNAEDFFGRVLHSFVCKYLSFRKMVQCRLWVFQGFIMPTVAALPERHLSCKSCAVTEGVLQCMPLTP